VRATWRGKRIFENPKDCPDLRRRRAAVGAQAGFDARTVPPQRPAAAAVAKAVAAGTIPAGNVDAGGAIDKYLENASTRARNCAGATPTRWGQFFKSCGNKPVASITKQELIASPRSCGTRTWPTAQSTTALLSHDAAEAFWFKDVKHALKFTEKNSPGIPPR